MEAISMVPHLFFVYVYNFLEYNNYIKSQKKNTSSFWIYFYGYLK